MSSDNKLNDRLSELNEKVKNLQLELSSLIDSSKPSHVAHPEDKVFLKPDERSVYGKYNIYSISTRHCNTFQGIHINPKFRDKIQRVILIIGGYEQADGFPCCNGSDDDRYIFWNNFWINLHDLYYNEILVKIVFTEDDLIDFEHLEVWVLNVYVVGVNIRSQKLLPKKRDLWGTKYNNFFMVSHGMGGLKFRNND